MSGPKRRRYDAEFKRNAIFLAEEPSRNAHSVEQFLGIPHGMIGKWCRQLAKSGSMAISWKRSGISRFTTTGLAGSIRQITG